MGDTAGRSKGRVVNDNIFIVDIHQHRVVSGEDILAGTLVKDCPDSGLAADTEDLKRMPRLDDQGAQSLAEGVERPVQLQRVAELGCDLYQGYLMSRPTRADRVDFNKHVSIEPSYEAS